MTQLVKALENAADPELLPCTNETALVTDPDDPQHLQSKAFIYTTKTGNSSITIINHATEQDEDFRCPPISGHLGLSHAAIVCTGEAQFGRKRN